MQQIISTLRGYLEQVQDKTTPAVIFPIVAILYIILFFRYYRKISMPLAGTSEWIDQRMDNTKLTLITTRYPMKKEDVAPIIVITAAFSFLAFFRLGNTTAPQSFFRFSADTPTIVIELSDPQEIKTIMFYSGLGSGHYKLEFSEDGVTWREQKNPLTQNPDDTPTHAMDQSNSHLFKWRYAVLNDDNPVVNYIRLTASHVDMELGELALYGFNGALIQHYQIICPDAPQLFDEQGLIPERPTYMNSMYFDEIFHGRAGFEYLRNVYPYETTHPPLGKGIISASIFLFGMTPFGWRFIGAAFGTVMLTVLYILIKNMFGKTSVAVCGTLLLGFDCMRFTQTRIATIDTYGVFFILLAYFFMYRHITSDAGAPFRKSILPLALSGLAFGVGCASKWIVIYSGLGLAVLYVIRIFAVFKRYKEVEREDFGGYLARALSFAALFFIIIPAVIYCLSYIPYGVASGMTVKGGMLWDVKYYDIIWKNQVSMLNYHGLLTSQHPYSSMWWQWILDARPILYVNYYAGDLRSCFGAFGNPIVWWGGFIAMIVMAGRVAKRHDGKALFILIGYLSQLLPWLAISRTVFIYHYFASTLFLVLAISHMYNSIIERGRGRWKQAVYGYTSAAGVAFATLYPALSGIYVPRWYFTNIARWIPAAWPF
ncbi:MAG: glycosyltransferase family 39 protein [Oscillospiraceae bacterium]|nr:glycosyltransferase family 39 protein [Oscillospiraceae bacterium]